MIYETNSPDETFEIGRKLGQSAKAGQIICLNGDLGWKDCFYTGICKRTWHKRMRK